MLEKSSFDTNKIYWNKVLKYNQQEEYNNGLDIYGNKVIGYVTENGQWNNVSDVSSINKLYVSANDCIEITGITDISGMGYLVRGFKKDGSVFNYNFSNSNIRNLGNGTYRIYIPDTADEINYITISWLSSIQNEITIRKVYNDLFYPQFVNSEGVYLRLYPKTSTMNNFSRL